MVDLEMPCNPIPSGSINRVLCLSFVQSENSMFVARIDIYRPIRVWSHVNGWVGGVLHRHPRSRGCEP